MSELTDNTPEFEQPAPRHGSAPVRARRRPGFFFPTMVTAMLVATVLVSITPDLFTGNLLDPFRNIFSAQQGALVLNNRINKDVTVGIVAGHMGNDSGAVCADGITEADVNLKIATLVQQKLVSLGYKTDLLKEMDPRLVGYKASLLLSIHNDSCEYVNDQATGFKVARAMSNTDENLSNRLEACLRVRYQEATNLPWHDSVTNDMTLYHAFDEIDPGTPAAIIETGFLNLDYDILTRDTTTVANGVANGIICFLQNENVTSTETPQN